MQCKDFLSAREGKRGALVCGGMAEMRPGAGAAIFFGEEAAAAAARPFAFGPCLLVFLVARRLLTKKARRLGLCFFPGAFLSRGPFIL